MSSVIQNLLDGVIGDGARSTKFECFIHFNEPSLFEQKNDVIALVKTSQFPGKSHEVIDFKYKGRSIPIKGQTKYDNTWTCSFYLTEDHRLKKAFEDWIESIDQVHNIKYVSSSVMKAQETNNANHGSGYVTNLKIAQMDFHGSQETVVYELFNVFPKSVSAVDVDYSSVGTILEFTVEFSYSHFDSYVQKTNMSNFVDEFKSKAQNKLSEVVGDLKGKIKSVLSSFGSSINLNSLGGSLTKLSGDIGSILGTSGIGGAIKFSPSAMKSRIGD